MKELVDRILAGDAVDVSSDYPAYFLSVLKEPSGFKIGFVAPLDLAGQDAYCVDTRIMRDAGKRLVSLADELDSRMKFVDRCAVHIVTPSGGIIETYFDKTSAAHLADVAFGNIFRTRKEAEANKDAVLAKYKALEDEGSI